MEFPDLGQQCLVESCKKLGKATFQATFQATFSDRRVTSLF